MQGENQVMGLHTSPPMLVGPMMNANNFMVVQKSAYHFFPYVIEVLIDYS